MQALDWLRQARRGTVRSVGVFVADVGRGFLEVSHNTLALVGLAAVAVARLIASGSLNWAASSSAGSARAS